MATLFEIPHPGTPLYFGEIGGPVVLVVHDWFGRLPGLDDFARGLAHLGFRVIVPDLYSGVATFDPDTAEGLMQQLEVGTALAALDEEIRTARLEGSQRVGTVGFSMGGWLALLHAQGGATDAVVAYYATLTPSEHGVVPCPVQLHFAEQDAWGAEADPESFINNLKDHGTPVSEFHYLDTVHSFANAGVPASFSAPAAALAYARTAAFLEDELDE